MVFLVSFCANRRVACTGQGLESVVDVGVVAVSWKPAFSGYRGQERIRGEGRDTQEILFVSFENIDAANTTSTRRATRYTPV